jgi:hypothetical protein
MSDSTYTVFEGHRRLANGDAGLVGAAASSAHARGASRVLIFDDLTGRQVEVDPRTNRLAVDTPAQPEPPAKPGRGRPKLGVVPREVTLLPRHWDWLARQPGGASAALRRLVDEARKTSVAADEAREAQLAFYGVMSVLAGDLAGFEEASRALFSGNDDGLERILRTWPEDIGDFLFRLAVRERAARLPPAG